MPKLIDITGQKFGRLTVIERYDVSNRSVRWLCVCECGNKTKVTGYALRSGHSNSCGCLSREMSVTRKKKHGQSKCNSWGETGAYKSWCSMLQRCVNTKNPYYSNYGARGITVCNDWRDFQNFYRDMGPRPIGSSIDRIDGNGNYEPGNCRWADRVTQQNNTRRNRLIECHGKTQSIAIWAREIGVSYECLLARIARGWSVEEALSRKPQHRERATGSDDEQPWFKDGWCVTTSTEGRGD